MKILHIIQRYPPAIGGSETWCQGLCRYLAREGHEVKVLTLDVYNEDEFWSDPPRENCAFKFGRLEYDGRVKIIRCKRTKANALFFYFFRAMERLFKIYLYGPHSIEMFLRMPREIKGADIVHLHTAPYPHNLIGFFIARLLGKRVVMTPHFHIGHPQFETWGVLSLLKNCDAVFAVTDYERGRLISKGIDKDKIFVAYNAIDSAEFKPVDLEGFKKRVFQEYSIKEDNRIIIFIGRKIEYKGVDVLIEAVRQLKKDIPVKLFLVGPDFSWFDRYYSGLPDDDKKDIVNFGNVGHQEKVNLLYLSGLLALPSKFEAFGIVFLEAWACGLPVIGSSGPAVSEVIGDSGLTSDFGDVAGLREN
ncbi:MAG TPA: glycosyltransferase family 4 protein, partial [Candidatus Omnitrophota bacterium]|nr:glycosyltransferase family 4 protein [Candidatus Omnitrophota bacterium]